MSREKRMCPQCWGERKALTENGGTVKCPTCKGRGWIYVDKAVCGQRGGQR